MVSESLLLQTLAELVVISRVAKKRPETVSLKWEVQPSSTFRRTHPWAQLLEAGYLIELPIVHPHFKWQVYISEEGQRVASEANVAAIVMDLYEVAGLKLVTGLVLNMSIDELPELLTHSDGLLRNWAKERFNSLLGEEQWR